MHQKIAPNPLVILSLACLALLFVSSLSLPMADENKATETSVEEEKVEEATDHIVYALPPEGEDQEIYNIRTLAAVVGSEEAAKKCLTYHYKHAASGFAAKLTSKQVEELSKQPGVLQVMPSMTYQLHGPRMGTGMHLNVV